LLFNSYSFIFLFLPVVLLGFHLIGSVGHHRVAIAWLVGASLFYYGWWNPAYLGLIIGSMLVNYAVGIVLSSTSRPEEKKIRKWLLIAGISANLLLLGYYKYANFFVENINTLAGLSLTVETIILPLAISFFTFQQITYLVDAYRGTTHEYSFLHYALFVTFFPQLIAGPIVHHKEMLPQFARDALYTLRARHLAVGLTIFAIGLFKKVVFADGVAVYATQVFNAAEAGVELTFVEAWSGALAYSLQLYFDFSGYSDMAIGIARMFGIRLPLNFNSPYKACSIIDFWHRWHITLSRFLRDYLYLPLGGSRKGETRRLANLLITMLLGGLWHGAGWTFVIWGGLHGVFLAVNHGWRKLVSTRIRPQNSNVLGRFFSWSLTFTLITIAWVPFRAATTDGAANILRSMLILNGREEMFNNGLMSDSDLQFMFALLLVAIVFPNTQQIMRRYRPAFETYQGEIPRLHRRWLEWRPTMTWNLFCILLLVLSVLNMTGYSEFLYFQF
jgi:alginate O-acetyltransferase complex protein AlgI